MKHKYMIAVVLVCLISSCGYKLQGGGSLPGKSRTVSVAIFKNRSSLTGAETIFSNALIEEISKNSSARIVNFDSGDGGAKDPVEADAVIRGTVVSISFDALVRTAADSVYKRGIRAVVNIEMKGRRGEVFFTAQSFTQKDSYVVSGDSSVDEAVIYLTVRKIAADISRKIVSRMTDDF